MGEPRHRLADGDDLTGFGQRRGDDAVGIRPEVGIAALIARQLERAPGTLEPPFGFVFRRLLAVEVRDRGVATPLQRRVTLIVGRRLRDARGGCGKLGFRALDLQLQVLGIEARDDVARMDAVADID